MNKTKSEMEAKRRIQAKREPAKQVPSGSLRSVTVNAKGISPEQARSALGAMQQVRSVQRAEEARNETDGALIWDQAA